MNPFLEMRWDDVHLSLAVGASAAIQQQLPNGLRARVRREVVSDPDDQSPLASTFRPNFARLSVPQGDDVAEPIRVSLLMVDIVDRWVEIIESRNAERVVTSIEFLNPWSKRRGLANRRYRRKLQKYAEQGANVVEIDLVRGPRENLIVDPAMLPTLRRADYLACINRRRNRHVWDVYPMSLREPLPTIPIPCRSTDPDVRLPLQPLVDKSYVDGGHDDIDYTKPLANPLSPEDQTWVDDLIKQRAAIAD